MCAAAAWSLLLPILLAGCAVGPNFEQPEAPIASSYIPSPLTNTETITNVAGGEAQRFAQGMDIPGEWWKLFHSQPLNDLIQRAFQANPDLKSAQAAVVAARENVYAQAGSYYPSIGGSFSASRSAQSTFLSPVPNATLFQYDLFTPELSVAYTPDVFGLNRRTVESLRAQEEQQRFALLATYITLSANVVNAAINEASLRGQIAATRALIVENTKALDILRLQFSKGYAGRLDVAAQESQLASLVATLPPLLKSLAQQRDALAVLIGVVPSQDPPETFELKDLQLPRELPVSLPSKLVEQRPDVRQAAENLHAACAAVGIAVANRLPNFQLSADIGNTALKMEKLFSSGTAFWGIAAGVTQPIFEGGALLHKQRAAQAAYVQAAEQYRSTVLSSFQNVADTLNALTQDDKALKAASDSERAAAVTLNLTEKQLQTGYTSYLGLVTAETAYQQALLALVQAQANRFADTAALFMALGGGWWNQPNLVPEKKAPLTVLVNG